MPETVPCYDENVEELSFPKSRVEPLVNRILENGHVRLQETAQGWWETEEDGFVLLVAWHQKDNLWEFFLRWECEEAKGASGLYRVEGETEREALEQLVPAMKIVLATPVAHTNGNGHHPEKSS